MTRIDRTDPPYRPRNIARRTGPTLGFGARRHTRVIHPFARIYGVRYAPQVAATLSVLEVIAEPTRRRILDAVRTGERSVGELVDEVGMHQPGVSRHLKVLRDAGLVEVRPDAQRRLYRLRAEPLRELDDWLEPYRAEWSNRLDALERHLSDHGRAAVRDDEEPR